MTNDTKSDGTNTIVKFALAMAALLFVGSIIASMLFETVLPLVRQGDWRGFWMHMIGLPIILLGTGIFVWGGVVFVRATLGSMGNDEFNANRAAIVERESRESARAAQRAQLGLLARTWLPGTLLLLLGFALIAVGSFFINVLA